MRADAPASGWLHHVLLAAVPSSRADIVRGLATEAATLPPRRERRQWLLSAYIYAIREGRMTWLRLAVSSASILFILWVAYNAIDSRFAGTGAEVASSVALVVLLTTTVAIMTPWRLLSTIVGFRRKLPADHM